VNQLLSSAAPHQCVIAIFSHCHMSLPVVVIRFTYFSSSGININHGQALIPTSMASENTAFSTSGEDAITRSLDVDLDQTAKDLSLEEFNDFYDIERTAKEIINGDYKKVGLHIFN
jgi:hypothetical protein